MSRFLLNMLMIFCLFSCTNLNEQKIESIVKHWVGHKIVYPSGIVFTNVYGDTIIRNDSIKNYYTIINYVDSMGCVSCDLNMGAWKNFISLIDSLSHRKVLFQFVFQPYRVNEIMLILRREQFTCPIYIDQDCFFDRENHFPRDKQFCTFLLNSENEVLAIGNPIHNPKIKELYLKIIQGKPIGEEKDAIKTQVAMPETSFTFGNFDCQEAQTHSFEVKNVGHELLVIQDVTTSCGCITVDYPKEPVRPGSTAVVKVTYKADQQGYFNKTVTVYGNAEQFPLSLHVSGNAKQLTTIDN